MGGSLQPDAKMAHVNLMTDTIIANLPEEGLRSVLRSMLATDPSITKTLEQRTKVYLTKQSATPEGELFAQNSSPSSVTSIFRAQQGRIRAMLGCGLCYESIPLLAAIVKQANNMPGSALSSANIQHALITIEGDIIQALTAIQKILLTPSGSRPLEDAEHSVLADLYHALLQFQQSSSNTHSSAFERSLAAIRTSGLLPEEAQTTQQNEPHTLDLIAIPPLPTSIETFQLNNKTLPRLFSGLWQLSSPSWGAASISQIRSQFIHYASHGFTAYDMADHYGDAEIIFGSFRSSCNNPDALFGATKYCVFTPTTITPEVVAANVSERCQRMKATYIDLLQFHWQDYSDKQYIAALRYLQSDSRVHNLGLCNFDTEHMSEILDAGIKIVTNQVQFSLIDSRPLSRMAAVCKKHNVKLLTYGTLLGGFLSSKWLDRPEPDLYTTNITPSQRKYYEMILNWGSWSLFQELLRVLEDIAKKHGVSLSNVATRWVLDFDFVGAVIVGTRWGVSDNAEDNLKVYGLVLDGIDKVGIDDVLRRSRREEMVEILGDCGGEYR